MHLPVPRLSDAVDADRRARRELVIQALEAARASRRRRPISRFV